LESRISVIVRFFFRSASPMIRSPVIYL